MRFNRSKGSLLRGAFWQFFVTTLGPEVIQYGYNTTPGGLITIGVPEPATWVMLIVGFGILEAAAGVKPVRKPRLT